MTDDPAQPVRHSITFLVAVAWKELLRSRYSAFLRFAQYAFILTLTALR
jgi:hypothetical protein